MTITTDLQTINENYLQAEIVLKYRDKFKECYKTLSQLDSEIDEIVDNVRFTAIPPDVKSALNAYRQLMKTFIAEIRTDSDIIDLLEI